MEQLIAAAFGMGLVGSLHCVGMCGPLALALPISDGSPAWKFTGAAVYNLGRIVTYSALGLLFGLIGKTIAIAGYQQWLSVSAGLLILLFVLVPGLSAKAQSNWLSRFFNAVRNYLSAFFQRRNLRSLFITGMLNGLLPCGLVYMALAGAIATGDLKESIVFMAFFGAGTLPLMWSVIFFGNFITLKIRQSIRKAYPVILSVTACLLIVRGLGLGIPYLSPKQADTKTHEIICCPKP